MAVTVFDIDQSFEEDPNTKDLKEIYNEDAINQSIDIWVSNPYRIGVGLTNSIYSSIFRDLNFKTKSDVIAEISREFKLNYQDIIATNINVEYQKEKRRILITITWRLKVFDITGTYSRYWYSNN